jgi:hypothetical protein
MFLKMALGTVKKSSKISTSSPKVTVVEAPPFFFAGGDFVEGGLGDEDASVVDEFWEVSVDEGEEEGGDVVAVGGIVRVVNGCKIEKGRVVTNGGRVLCVTALGLTVGEAKARAYELTEGIRWNRVYYRTDIGYRAVGREG